MFKITSPPKNRHSFAKKSIIRPSIIDEQTDRRDLNLRGVWVIVLCYLFMSFVALCCIITRIILLGRGENFCRTRIVKPVFRLFFKVVGVQINYPKEKLPKGQTIFIFNHSSTLDNFLIVALGLSDTRYFLSWGSTYKVLPMTLTSLLLGTIYTPSQKDRAARVRCFRNAEKKLKKTGYSTILTPEGSRICSGEIGQYNKGAFHLATNLKIPIVPLYIYIPHHINSWASFYILPGEITVDVLPEIDTSQWTLDSLHSNRKMVRDTFVRHHTSRHAHDKWF